ncbi:MAG TPA: Gfo/Idh/MocA family oxidoreductase [Candidatus Sumerlaeota bacterium]|nr:Gfo/Idh/MocA family oxidoreductase [Candidatus Sumerlaeota bacterium]HPR99974.1 Gfo/Idh/MocA family oxidoreductase [Candidatus Sumerlaeota bacterium]
MQKKNVRAGIVGAGFSASFHFEALQKVYGTHVEVAGVYALDPVQCRDYAEKRGIVACTSLDDLFDRCDVVHVCVTATAHEEVTVAALRRDKFVICEKPLTGYFGDGTEEFHGDRFPRQVALDAALASVRRILDAEATSQGRLCYAENWVYAPSIQKEREILEKTGSQILWIHAEEAHSGSHAHTYAYWKYSGGGVLIGKGCHPLTAALYLKRVEGRARDGRPIQPKAVSARTHALTRLSNFRDEGHLRCNYHDIDDFSMMHVVFDDNTIATVFASDIIMGGIHNWLEVAANNHRTVCNINPNTAMQTYNPVDANFNDIYVVEKTGTKQGWSCPSPDEDWFTGYPQEIEAFYRAAAYGEPIESDSRLAADAISTLYSAYVSAERGGAETPIQTF